MIIIGGSSGMGLAIAQACAKQEAAVVICGRSQEKLEKAVRSIGGKIETAVLDISDETAVEAFFKAQDAFDHLITPGAEISAGPFTNFPVEEAKRSFQIKFWGQYCAARSALSKIRKGGSIIFFSGVYGRRPSPGVPNMASINAAIEGLGRALAVELGPAEIRVNVISPGLIHTPAIDTLPSPLKENMFQEFSEKTALKRIGLPEEAAQAAIYLMTNPYVTGTTLFIDGGYVLN